MPGASALGKRTPVGRPDDSRYIRDSRSNALLPAPPIATRCRYYNRGLSDGVKLGGTARIKHTTVATAYGLRLVYANFYATSSGSEFNGANDITVKASLEYPGWNLPVPVYFRGQRSVTIPPGAVVVSDPIGIDVALGASVYSRTYVTIASGTFPLNMILTGGGIEGDNYANPAGSDVTDVNTSPGSTSNSAYGPLAIIGSTTQVNRPIVANVGDSIQQGFYDTPQDLGFVARALNAANLSMIDISRQGDSSYEWAQTSSTFPKFKRMGLLLGATHAIAGYGANDIVSSNVNTLGDLQANQLVLWNLLAGRGIKTWTRTLNPRTTSTDSFATVTNQTPTAKDQIRIDFNNWIRGGAPLDPSTKAAVAVGTVGALTYGKSGHPLQGYFEVADTVESSRDSGKWKVGYVFDGTHPNATGHAAMAAVIDTAKFV